MERRLVAILAADVARNVEIKARVVETEMMPMVTDLGASFLCSCTPMVAGIGMLE